jgi:ribonuclease P protein component
VDPGPCRSELVSCPYGVLAGCRSHPRDRHRDELNVDRKESDREQAHLPAEQPSTGQEARVPVAHAHPCRSRHHLRPPDQGSQRTVGLSRHSPAIGVLSPAHRMRRSTDFAVVVRSGSRARRGCLVVHQRRQLTTGAPRIGLVVGRSVGGSVVRHRVSRRLRAQLAERIEALEPGSGVVVRALPEAALADSAAIGRDLDAALAKLAGVR